MVTEPSFPEKVSISFLSLSTSLSSFKDLKLISLGVAGGLAAYFCSSSAITEFGAFAFQVGDPLTIYLIVIVVAILMRIIFVFLNHLRNP